MNEYVPEFGERTAQCRAGGHDLTIWRKNYAPMGIYCRLLCQRCGLTFPPILNGSAPLAETTKTGR